MTEARRRFLIASGICLMLAATFLVAASFVMFVRSPVANIRDVRFFSRENAPGFIWQDATSPRLKAFRELLPSDVREIPDPYLRALAIRKWVRAQQPPGDSWKPVSSTFWDRVRGNSEDPFALLQSQRSASPANCRRFSIVYAAAAASAGLRSRVAIVSENFRKSNTYSHVMTEVWIPAVQKWVLMDPMWDLTFLLDDKPASVTDVYAAMSSNRSSQVSLLSADGVVKTAPSAIQREFRHAYFDGCQVCFRCSKPISFAHLSTDYSPDYPERLKQGLMRGSGLLVMTGLLCLFGGLTDRRIYGKLRRPRLAWPPQFGRWLFPASG